ncbi:MAG: DUF1302 family protein [Neptuniibacter sp.]
MMKRSALALAVSQCLFVASQNASAIETGVDGLSVNGRLKQSISYLYDLENGSEVGPANGLAELNASYRPNRNITYTGNVWLRGMWNDPSWKDPNGGLKTFNGPTFPSGSFEHGTGDCNTTAGEFCGPNNQVKLYDDFDDEILREAAVKYRDPKRRYSVKVGKFQRGWGQSDGLRLLDILHPQDLRQKFVFGDADETRIPLWMANLDVDLNRAGLGNPFEALGMDRAKFELNIAPEIRHSELVVNNPTPMGRTDGGHFGLPWPDLVDVHGSGLGAVGFGGRLMDIEKDDFEWDAPEIAARLKFDAFGGEMTLNGFYGYQDLPILKLGGGTVHVGSGVNDPAEAVQNVTVDHNTLMAAIWAPDLGGGASGYLPYLRNAANGAPTISPLTALTGGACADPVNGSPGLACSVTADLYLDYTYRQKVIGLSFARDMSDMMSLGPKGTAPSIRLEASYEFDKPFNKIAVDNPFVPNQIEMGAVANLVSPASSVVFRDVVSVMAGFDYPLWIPGWETQSKSIFTSFQFFNIHTENADGLMAQAPYGLTAVNSNQQYMTFLWDMKLDNERLAMEGLLIQDLNGQGTSYRQRIGFNYWGKNLRPEIEIQHFNGTKESAPIGLFNDKDYIEFSLTYQF